jgi:hypothetical protein
MNPILRILRAGRHYLDTRLDLYNEFQEQQTEVSDIDHIRRHNQAAYAMWMQGLYFAKEGQQDVDHNKKTRGNDHRTHPNGRREDRGEGLDGTQGENRG